MQLIAVKQHLKKVKSSSLLELCRALKIHPDVLRDMLQHWIRKGKVCQKTRENACGKTCVQCDPMFVEIYCWVTPFRHSSDQSPALSSLDQSPGQASS